MPRDPERLYRGVGSQTALEVPHEHEHECEDAQQGHAEPEIKHELPHLKTLRAERELRGLKKVGEFGKGGFVTLTDKALKNFGVGPIAYIKSLSG
jgi:hypothetical protein